MEQPRATLLVQRVEEGKAQTRVSTTCQVIVDGLEAGVIGELISITPGRHVVRVHTLFWTCNPLPVELEPYGGVTLHYTATPLRRWALYAGFPVLALLSPLLVEALKWLRDAIGPLPGLSGVGALLLFMLVCGWVGFGALPFLLAWAGVYCYRLSEAPGPPEV